MQIINSGFYVHLNYFGLHSYNNFAIVTIKLSHELSTVDFSVAEFSTGCS